MQLMARGRLRRSGLGPAVLLTLFAMVTLAGALGSGWGPKLGLDLEGGFAVTLQPVEDAADDALDQAIEIIRTRVDALGVAEPEITRQGSTIVVNLPGVTDRERARELVAMGVPKEQIHVITPLRIHHMFEIDPAHITINRDGLSILDEVRCLFHADHCWQTIFPGHDGAVGENAANVRHEPHG